MKHEMESDGLPVWPDLSDERNRRRLGNSAIKVFSRIMRKWNVPAEDARQLLALLPGTAISDLDSGVLTQEQMLRISCVIGIYRNLHVYWEDKLADRWIRLSNLNELFRGGLTPLEYMVRGGLDAMRTVRNLLDSWCADNW